MQPLFRPEAVAHATGRLDGAVLLPAPIAAWGAVAFAVATLALGGWFCATATYTSKESVSGRLSPQSGMAHAVAEGRGTVAELLVYEGARVEAGTPLASIDTPPQPATDELVAELLVPAHLAGFVAVGQKLRLRYDALPFGRSGIQQGVVTGVSATALGMDEVDATAIPVAGPVFPVRVRLDAQRIDVDGVAVPLRAGMLLTTDIVGYRRTLFESLFGRQR